MATATAMEMPTPVLPDSVSPSAVVSTALSSFAVADSAPVRVNVPPGCAPSVACVSLLETDTATTGVTAVEPFAPLFASVLISAEDSAVSVRSCAAVTTTPSPIRATVVFWPTFTATDAPTPTSVPTPPPFDGSAFAVFAAALSAFRLTSLLPVIVTLGAPMLACVSVVAMLIATEPATPVLPPPAPEVDCAPNVSVSSSPTAAMVASTVTPAAVTSAASSVARLVTFA